MTLEAVFGQTWSDAAFKEVVVRQGRRWYGETEQSQAQRATDHVDQYPRRSESQEFGLTCARLYSRVGPLERPDRQLAFDGDVVGMASAAVKSSQP